MKTKTEWQSVNRMAIIAIVAIIGLFMTTCDNNTDRRDNNNGNVSGNNKTVTFKEVTANGDSTQTTTMMKLFFDKTIDGLTASDITLSGVPGVIKGTLSSITEGSYSLTISGISSGGTLNVAVAKSGVTIRGSPKTVTIYYYSNPKEIEMVSIPSGTFTMGSPSSETGRGSDETQHSVTLSGFSMGKYEVTQVQWVTVMGASENRTTTDYGKGDKYPVYNVSWYDAIVFCNKLSINEGLDPVYSISGKTNPADWETIPTDSNSTWDAAVMDRSKNGYRLPTEAEWEYACRAGTTTAYNTGNTISDNTGWYYDNSGSKTHEVGLKTANAWGLYDMHGNVFEWCWDRYGSYSSGAQMNPAGAVTGASRVQRGGSWYYYSRVLRSACRGYVDPSNRGRNDGFGGLRLVRP